MRYELFIKKIVKIMAKGKSKQLKQDKFKKLHPEGRKIYSLRNRIKTMENNLIIMKKKLETLLK